ncbi:MAG: hypothetical protein ACI4WV_02315 [Eubacteriales bacterium]
MDNGIDRMRVLRALKCGIECICATVVALLFLWVAYWFSEMPLGWGTVLYFVVCAGIPALIGVLAYKFFRSALTKWLTMTVMALCLLASVIFFLIGRTYVDRQVEPYRQGNSSFARSAELALSASPNTDDEPEACAYIRDGWWRRAVYLSYTYDNRDDFLSAVSEVNRRYAFMQKGDPGYANTDVCAFIRNDMSFRVVNLETLSCGTLTYPYVLLVGVDETNCQIVYFFIRDRENFFGKVLTVSLVDTYMEMLE